VRQRPAQPGVDFPGAYKQAREWISNCLLSHEKCPKKSTSSILPTRVIDISTERGEQRIRLHISNDEHATYAALSYCWGSTPQLTTTQEKLHSLTRDGIEIEKLPKTLQDAIHATRKLEIQYLWIDSLCIIQDSAEDKAIEISKMSQIYKEAVVTISAAVASDCGHGFLEDRKEVRERLDASFFLPYALTDEIEAEDLPRYVREGGVGQVYLCQDSSCGFEIRDFTQEAISQRAWTLQESWLSPRLLIYGSGPLKWQCLTASHSFGGTPPSQAAQEIVPIKPRQRFFPSSEDPTPSDTETISSDWQYLVRQYTSRAITDPNDKLPALSGIAAEFQRLSGDEYLAGLWRSTLPHSLLWHQLPAPSPKPTKNIIQLPSAYRAPSWSWASVDGTISTEPRNKYLARTDIIIHSVYTTPASALAPLGKVTAGILTLSGLMRRMSWKQVQQRYVIPDSDRGPHMVMKYPNALFLLRSWQG
jgi:Heterokaryon incompatibility protein (HET)